MISFLSIKNLVTITNLTLELENGLTTVTGETGAGKSIILGAIELALGARSEVRWIRNHCDKAEVSIQFDLHRLPEARQWLSEHDFEQGDQECLIRRILRRDGKSRAYINGSPAKLQQLKELGTRLAIIHNQHDSWQLLSPEHHINWLDSFGQHAESLQIITDLTKQWSVLNHKRQQLEHKKLSLEQQSQLNHYFLQELLPFELYEGKVESIEQRFKQADQYKNANTAVLECLSQLGDDHHSASSHLIKSIKLLEHYAHYFPALESSADTLSTALNLIDDAHHRLNQFVQSEPESVDLHSAEEDEQQLNALYALARKHKIQPCALWEFQASLQNFEDEVARMTVELESIKESLADIQGNYTKQARKLSEQRRQSAECLCQKITSSLKALGMPHARFHFELSPDDANQPRPNGMDKFQFLMCANPGQALQPLQSSASGGELSRVSLALQLVCQNPHNARTMIFDEVDTGISGKAAENVGQQLRQLGECTQVMCITHLAQVASCGHHHLEVTKEIVEDTTLTHARWLDEQVRVRAIAGMMASTTVSKSLECAEAMITHAKVQLKKIG